ncbi:unnamed protein product [Agarophyton chilense]
MSFFSVALSIALLALLFSPSQATEGFLGPCRTNSDCVGERACREIAFDFKDITLENIDTFSDVVKDGCGRNAVYCNAALNAIRENIEAGNLRSVFCDDSFKCPSGRQCVGSPSGICLAKLSLSTDGNAESGDQGDDSSEVCIAAKSLAHLDRNHLIYRNHVSARVLCDSFQSCATAGHMVRYRGDVMMMKTYCRLIGGCTRSVMPVNSPRYRRALQIPSDTPHLTFTAFAARYVTSAEENVLRTAVRLGL